MVQITPFKVEQWMDKYEGTDGVLNIAETCAASISIDQLVDMCEDKSMAGPLTLSTKLTYGAIRGSNTFRERVAAVLSRGATTPLARDDILITQGAIMANFLVLFSLVGSGDHVICVYPTYAQLYEVPASLGAEVSLWKLRAEDGFVPDVMELRRLIKSNTKLIVINNPNNPTGVAIPQTVLEEIVRLARSRGITVLADEVYSPLFHSLPEAQDPPTSILSLGYEKTIATGSMSKAYALAGIRIGWIASRDSSVLERVLATRDYTSISVSQLDDQVASYALSDAVLPSLMQRNMALVRTNLGHVRAFVEKYSSVCSWVLPTSGTTTLLCFQKQGRCVDDEAFAVDLLKKTKVLVVPAASCFGAGKDFQGSVRVGYGCETAVLVAALSRLSDFVEQQLV